MKKIFLLLAVIAAISSCKTDFDTIAPYKEVMVVYGLMNPNDSIQYIRVGKAYLGEGNALVMAQQSDSINYADVLDVKIDRTLNGNTISSYSLTRDTFPKEAGTFSGVNIVYSYRHPVVQDNSKYKITVHNSKTGVTVTSTTGIVKDPRKDNGDPGIESPTYASITDFAQVGSLIIKYQPDIIAREYDVILRFYYKDSTSSAQSTKSFDWDLGTLTITNTNEDVDYRPVKRDFFAVAAANILPDDSKWRRINQTYDIIVTGVTEEVATYISLTNPTTGIAQDHPFYSNIEDGIGLFSSRNVKVGTGYLIRQSPYPAYLDSLRRNVPGINWY